MKAEHMVHNLNQIALNFASYPREDAIKRIADHLLLFWERRMKKQLHEYVASGGAGLHELVLEAEKLVHQAATPTSLHREGVTPPPQAP